MKMIPIAEHPGHAQILWDLLAEREPSASISHRKMPTMGEHLAFVEKMDPDNGHLYDRYMIWDLIEVDGRIVGSIYLTQDDEIGISIFKAHQRKGYATAAIKKLMVECMVGPFYANVAPTNTASRAMFEKLGFKVIQQTLMLEAE